MENNALRLCLYCSKNVIGRSDKRFCNEYCRNNYNNMRNSAENNLVRNINNILRKNRRILKELLNSEDTVTSARERLVLDGFNFKYYTHTYVNQKQQTYYFVYEYGYLPLSEDKVLIVIRKGQDTKG